MPDSLTDTRALICRSSFIGFSLGFFEENAIYFFGNKNVMAKRRPQSGPPLGFST